MIFITVRSEIQDTNRQFEKSKEAEKYLKKIKELHDMARLQKTGPPPNKKANWRERESWEELQKMVIPLRIDILDTDAAQLSLTPILIQASI